MRNIFFTVGPTQTHPSLGKFLNDGLKKGIYSISHRGREFGEIFAHTVSSLKKLLNVPVDFHVFFIGSATEAMELIIENCVEDKSFHFVNGAFSKRFFQTAQELRKHPNARIAQSGEGFDFANVKIPKYSELVGFTQNETSTGVKIEMADIRALKKKNPDKLFAVDIVSATPYAPVDWGAVDCAFFSVQKGFGMPSGMGVVIANDRCIKKAEKLHGKGMNIGSFHSFPTLLKSARKNQTPETPNAMAIYILGRICDSYNKYGLDKIRKETEIRAGAMYDFFDKHSAYKPFVKNKKWRSKTVVVFNTPNGSAPVIKRLQDNGYIVGAGYGEFESHHIRIGNFPMHKISDVKKIIKLV
ncbi:MAG: aminotransferase class V-fold PLP-dependent enzyme [Candidatus Kaiserbacteria bacterium]|nr:aminotransferase class V-fold PLP-dependent enzyme [Candidatus Kaiserbacteria bacterium]